MRGGVEGGQRSARESLVEGGQRSTKGQPVKISGERPVPRGGSQ
jgi:hypothetical protein